MIGPKQTTIAHPDDSSTTVIDPKSDVFVSINLDSPEKDTIPSTNKADSRSSSPSTYCIYRSSSSDDDNYSLLLQRRWMIMITMIIMMITMMIMIMMDDDDNYDNVDHDGNYDNVDHDVNDYDDV